MRACRWACSTNASPRSVAINLNPFARTRPPIRVLLADDHVVFGAGVRALLKQRPDLAVVGEAGTGNEAVASAAATRPDVVLMDLAMPGEGGLVATRRIVALGIGAKVLVLTGLPQEKQLLDALEAGASGFVEKAGPVGGVARGGRTGARGRVFLGGGAAKVVVLPRHLRVRQARGGRPGRREP